MPLPPFMTGTRQPQTTKEGLPSSRSISQSLTEDVGMTKNVSANCTFAPAAAEIQAANGTFVAFVTNDDVMVEGAELNNGFFRVTGIDVVNHAYLTVDPAPKTEGPILVTIRTP